METNNGNNLVERLFEQYLKIINNEIRNEKIILNHNCEIIEIIKDTKIDTTNEKMKNKLNFNVFLATLNIDRERYHSNFIAYLLNPKETHGFGSEFLRLFLEESFRDDTEYLNYLKSENILDVSVVYTEKIIDDNRRLDIFIRCGSHGPIIIIENKIFADEMENQIKDYLKFAEKKNHNSKVLFLTSDGREPISLDKSDVPRIKCISYKSEIINWLKECASISKKYNNVTCVIYQYIDALKYLFNYLEDVQMSKIKEFLLEDNNRAELILDYYYDFSSSLKAYSNDLKIDLLDNIKVVLDQKFNKQFSNLRITKIKKNYFKFESGNNSFNMILQPYEGDLKGSWWGIYDKANKGLKCGLKEESWERIFIDGIDDFEYPIKASAKLLSIKTDKEKYDALIEEISEYIYSQIVQKVFPLVGIKKLK